VGNQSVKLLGFILDKGLNWHDQIDYVHRKLTSISYLLLRLRDVVETGVLGMVYLSLFQGILNYGIRFWGGVSYARKLLNVHKKTCKTNVWLEI